MRFMSRNLAWNGFWESSYFPAFRSQSRRLRPSRWSFVFGKPRRLYPRLIANAVANRLTSIISAEAVDDDL